MKPDKKQTETETEKKSPEKKGEANNAFTSALGAIRRGAVAAEAAAKMEEVLAAVGLTGKAGSVTVTLKFEPTSVAGDQVLILPTVKAKVPEDPLPPGLFWVDENHQLHDKDPNQGELELRTVRTPAPARSVEG